MKVKSIIAVISATFMVSCGGGAKAPTTADGSRVSIALLSDRGIREGMTDQVKGELNELGAWMEQDLMRIFREGGYDIALIASREDFTLGRGKFLLTFTITHYRPGRISTREEAGFGQGVVEIDTQVALFKDNVTLPVLQKKQGDTSGREWQYCAGQVNLATAPAVSDRIHELY
jgi:hypothetical protein